MRGGDFNIIFKRKTRPLGEGSYEAASLRYAGLPHVEALRYCGETFISNGIRTNKGKTSHSLLGSKRSLKISASLKDLDWTVTHVQQHHGKGTLAFN